MMTNTVTRIIASRGSVITFMKRVRMNGKAVHTAIASVRSESTGLRSESTAVHVTGTRMT
jgi:hypothetical protein